MPMLPTNNQSLFTTMRIKSLQTRQHQLAQPSAQLEWLTKPLGDGQRLPMFQDKLLDHGFFPLQADKIDILQVNVGKACNQTCKHCHVDAGPDRTETMDRQTMQQCLDAMRYASIGTLDITGGAPEMNPNFRWLVEEARALGRKVMVRCNLTILLANPKYLDLPAFYAHHGVNVVSSLPHFSAQRTDTQRGEGVFDKSIKALLMLNEVGYGHDGSGLELDLVYNPSGAFVPSGQASLEKDFKKQLKQKFGVVFNRLFAITNMPISRYLEYLIDSGNYEAYMQKLVDSFNPSALPGLMCRNMLSVGYDGKLYDCDFNQMLDLPIEQSLPQHIADFANHSYHKRNIRVHNHCYGCAAGQGSSCGGATV